MQSIQLHNDSGNPQVDEILCGLIGIFEAVFPGRVRSYYLVGSQASGIATRFSDIDFRVIFEGDFGEGEEERMLSLRQSCRLICPVQLDCPPLSEHRLKHDEAWLHETLSIKASGMLLYGEDSRNDWPPPDFDAYVRNVTEVPPIWMSRLRKNLSPLVFPLTYPDPEGEFYGYEQMDVHAGEPSLKLWVLAVGYAATCIVALQAGQIVVKKEDWLPMYRQHIGDEWTEWLDAVYNLGNRAWRYRIPTDAAGRSTLRDLCRRTLAFENHYLSRYRSYLLDALRSSDTARQEFASQRLKAVHFPDDELLA